MSDTSARPSNWADIANPTRFIALADRLVPWLAVLSAVLLRRPLHELRSAVGLPSGQHGAHHVHPRAFRLLAMMCNT